MRINHAAKKRFNLLGISILLSLSFSGCSSPTERAEHYYSEGMALIDKNPAEATKQLQNAIQLNKGMAKAYYALAQIAEKNHDLQQTYNFLSEVVALDPKNLDAQLKLAHLYLLGGKPNDGLKISQKAVTDYPDNADVLGLHALALMRTNDLKNAVVYANKALNKKPDIADALLVLAFDGFQAKEYEKSLDFADKALAKDNKNISLLILKGNIYEQTNRLPQAEETYLNITNLYPDNLDLKNALTNFYIKNKMLDKAEAQLKAIADKTPTDIKPKIEVIRFLIRTQSPAAGRAQMESYVQKEPKNYALKFALAQLYQEQQDLPAHQRVLNEIVSQAKDSPDGLKAKAALANLALASGDKANAKKLSEEVLAVDKANEQSLLIKAALEIDAKKYDDAVADLRLVQRDNPNSARAAILLATAFEASNKMELAEEQYTKAFQASKMATPYAIRYAKFLFGRNQAQRAVNALQDALKANPNDENLMLVIADIMINRGDFVAAQEMSDRIKANGDQTHSVDKILAAINGARQKNQQGIEGLKKTYEAEPTSANLGAVVQSYHRAGQDKLALSFLANVIAKQPDNADAIMIQGQLYVMQKDNTKAKQSFATMIEKAPKNPNGYKLLSALLMHEGNLKDAEATVTNGLTVIPNNVELNLNLALIKEKDAKYEDAIKLYEDLLKEHPDADVVLNNLANALLEGRKDSASYNKAYELAKKIKMTDVVQFKDTLGWTSYHVGKYDESVRLLEEVVAKDSTEPEFSYHLGKAYLAMKNDAKARTQFERALKLSENKKEFTHTKEIEKLLK